MGVAVKKILIVDDEPDLVEMARRKLERSGFEVDVACNGQEGLKLVLQGGVDLVVTDVVMPVMDGFTFYKELKDSAATSSIPVIILTARNNMEDSFKALGVDEFLAKPFDGEKLLNKVEGLVSDSIRTKKKKHKVLISSSQKKALSEMALLLENASCDVTIVEDGLDLIKKAYKMQPDIVLLDVLIDGFKSQEIIKALRSFGRLKNLKIITFTNFEPEELGDVETIDNLKEAKNDCMIAGATKYIGRFTRVSFLDNLREYGL